MKVGDRIRVQEYSMGYPSGNADYTVEIFRHCLGIFLSDDHRTASRFTPLCDIYCNGPDSEESYISNFGEYRTNQVQAWMDLPTTSTKGDI